MNIGGVSGVRITLGLNPGRSLKVPAILTPGKTLFQEAAATIWFALIDGIC